MYIRGREIQHRSLLHDRPLPAGAIVAGVFCTVMAHAAVVALGVLATHVNSLATPPKSYVDEHVVEARLVQLGKKRPKHRLPKKKIPRMATAPEQSVAVSKTPDPEPPKEEPEKQDPPKEQPDKPEPPPEQPKKRERPKEAVEDVLSRLGDRAQAFAEIAEEQEREGDPDGDPEGTALEAQIGDKYAGQLTAFFKRGWTIPTTLSDTSGLVTVATVELTRDLHVGEFTIIERSGEPLYDQSVEDRLSSLRDQRATLPEPPVEVAHRFLGQTIAVRFTDTGR